MESGDHVYDAVVVGSGFGGSMAAHALVEAGHSVLLIERGGWVERGPHNTEPTGSGELTPHFSKESPYKVLAGGYHKTLGAFHCVGGASVFYGCVSMRMRPADFEEDSIIQGDSGAEWPYSYDDLEPHYCRAEQLLGVSGDSAADPTDPPRTAPYPQPPADLANISRRMVDTTRSMGLNPFRLPLGINYSPANGREECTACSTCDTFACYIQAKNDVATVVIPKLLDKGLAIKTNTVAVRLVQQDGRITRLECHDNLSGKTVSYQGKVFVISGGTLASPHLLLSSGLDKLNPGGHTVGRYLMRHVVGLVYGLFPKRPAPEGEFHKQIAIHDFYFGHPSIKKPDGKLGCVQQIQTPPVKLAQYHLPPVISGLAALVIPHTTGLLVIAEDQPTYDNRVFIDPGSTDRFGLPRLVVTHRYTKRDKKARRALMKQARKILKKSGAWATVSHKMRTFSHAVGTVRMGPDPETSALDEFCAFRGVENLYVADGSFMPRSAGVNPSLTIAANALRVGDHIASRFL